MLKKISYFKFSTSATKSIGKQNNGFISKADQHSVMYDCIGPPDKVSNLRPIVRAIPARKMYPVEVLLHKRYEEIGKWNNDFWTTHNNRFYNEKVEFITCNKKSDEDEISADKLSEFYKTFLERNKKLHFYYNVSWYMKNVELLILEVQVKIRRLFNKNSM